MDGVVTTIQGLSGGDSDLAVLHTQLCNNAHLSNGGAALGEMHAALATLDAAFHSLGMLHILSSMAKQVPVADHSFMDVACCFLITCQPQQIRQVPELFVGLCRKLREQLMSAGCPGKGILPLQAAIRALQPSSDYLTPMHAECFLLCLSANCFNAANDLLSEDIYNVDPSVTGCIPKDLYLYCRYSATLCAGRKDWPRALELLMLALTAPSLVNNAIVLDCFKLYVLVSLIYQGSMPPLPKVVPQQVKSLVEQQAWAYTQLADAYATHQGPKLLRVVEQHSAVYTADGNLGLVHQVAASLTTRNIQRLTTTYLTLSLADIAAQVGLPNAESAEHHILKMVEQGTIFAAISEADGGGMVRFLEAPELNGQGAASARLTRAVDQCVHISSRVAREHHAVAASRDYLKKVVSRERNRYDAASMDEPPSANMFQP